MTVFRIAAVGCGLAVDPSLHRMKLEKRHSVNAGPWVPALTYPTTLSR